jgi:hypothetical protein
MSSAAQSPKREQQNQERRERVAAAMFCRLLHLLISLLLAVSSPNLLSLLSHVEYNYNTYTKARTREHMNHLGDYFLPFL